ncbi:hypothetical protein CgunFtcFv8_009466 [Champsocephalus gunnari]|uniref:Uncharacterized protein n=1 Tax=Champsocephalus gunnari TaxID=52237 RepID=A0AAN8GZ23_CHAGU|nr:hypothetical protein CgunFtcFv8_009466 [Champsocephalus gunnari]
MALSAVYTASLVGAVRMALDRPSVQTKAADAHRESLRDRKPGAENGRRRCEKHRRDSGVLSRQRHTAVPRNPSSKRDTASLIPWL